jgi:hypothetical protein
VALEEVQTLLKLLHGAVEGRSQEEDPQIPGVARVENLDSYAILAGLISFHTAAVVVADGGRSSWSLLRIHKVLRSWRRGWVAIQDCFVFRF